jgi:hypothetical protein
MSEEDSTPAIESADWQSKLGEVEKQLDRVSSVLDALREAVALLGAAAGETAALDQVASVDQPAAESTYTWPRLNLLGSISHSAPDVTSVAQKPEVQEVEARPPVVVDGHEDMSQIVARMRADFGDMDETEDEEAMPVEGIDQTPPSQDEAYRRQEEVSLMVARMRVELEAGSPDTLLDDAQDLASDDISSPAGVAAENEARTTADGAPVTGQDDDAVREEVRRAVEAARLEMQRQAGVGHIPTLETQAAPEATSADPKRISFADWPSVSNDIIAAPVIVIKDVEGRVQLAGIYEMLRLAHCSEDAALLNYTPHSVTIGLPMRAPAPSTTMLAAAIKSVFGRSCRVQSDGVRISADFSSTEDQKNEDVA